MDLHIEFSNVRNEMNFYLLPEKMRDIFRSGAFFYGTIVCIINIEPNLELSSQNQPKQSLRKPTTVIEIAAFAMFFDRRCI